MDLPGFNLVNTLLFPTPDSSYGVDDFPEELIWVPKTLDPETKSAEDCVPCLLLSSPSARFFILYFHSNAEDLGRSYTFCSMLRYQFQVHVLAVEYPGYGICPGEQANEETVIENAFLGFRFLRQVMSWPLDGIIVLGRSIGCGPALAIAAEHAVYGVILVCPFLSVRELCRSFVGRLADFIDERFPNKDKVRLLTSPLLLVHGKKDTVVPWTHGKRLYEACGSRKRMVAPENMHHNTNLHSDASYFVLPMLQFFGLPDYDFNEMRVPEWVFNKRLSPGYAESDGVQLGFPSSPATGLATCRAAEVTTQETSCKAMQLQHTDSTERSEGSSVSSEDRKQKLEVRENTTEEVAAAAVQRFLEVRGLDHLRHWGDKDLLMAAEQQLQLKGVLWDKTGWKDEQPSELVIESLSSDKEIEEPPEPPEDCGFLKVPRTRMGGPELATPEVNDVNAGNPLAWGLGWLTPRHQPRKPPISI